MAKIKQSVKDTALQWLTDVNSEFDTLNSRLKDKWLDWYTMYRTFENQQKTPGQSNVFVPKIYEIIEKKTPVVVAKKPRFLLTPRTNQANAYIGAVRDTLGFWWDEDEMQGKLEKWVKESFIYGVGLAKVDWHQETGMEKRLEVEIDEETQEVIEKEVEDEVVKFERPTVKLKSIFDIKVDPRVECFQEGIGIIEQINDVRWGELMEMKDLYDLSEVRDIDPEQLTDSPDDHEVEKLQEEGINIGIEEIDKNRITLYEYWGLFSPDENPKNEREYIITAIVVDNEPKYVIRVQENDLDFRPFVKLDNRVVRGEFYSIGEVEPLEGLQIEYNNLRNARVDFNNAVNYPEWIYNKNANINPAHLVHRPNNIIPVDLPLGSDVRSVLRPVDKPVQPISGYNEEGQMSRDFQTISQTIDFTDKGGAVGFTNTATGVRSRDIQVGIQANNVVNHLEKSISEIGRMWLALAEKFAEDEISVRRPRTEADVERDKEELGVEVPLSDVPDKFTKIEKNILEDAVGNFTVKVEAGSTTAHTAEGKAQDAVNIANTAVQFASLGVPIDLAKVFQDILRDSFQKDNPEEYMTEGQVLPQIEQPGQQTRPPLQPSQPNQSI